MVVTPLGEIPPPVPAEAVIWEQVVAVIVLELSEVLLVLKARTR